MRGELGRQHYFLFTNQKTTNIKIQGIQTTLNSLSNTRQPRSVIKASKVNGATLIGRKGKKMRSL